MPLLLTTPIPTGGLVPFDYDRVMIVIVQVLTRDKIIRLRIEYGTVQSDEWVPSPFEPPLPKDFNLTDGDGGGETGDAPTDFSDVLAELAVDGTEKLYDGVARVLYQWLIDKGHFVGTIE